MAEYIAVVDTETTWSGALMTIGIIIADACNYETIDYKYFVIEEAIQEGGIFGYVIHIKGIDEEKISVRDVENKVTAFLERHEISSVFAYNACFDKKCMPFLRKFVWHDIMKIAAYKQYNRMIPDSAECCKTGRLKSGYGVESIMRMLGSSNYIEIHNALLDARDELELMKLLGHPIEVYPEL